MQLTKCGASALSVVGLSTGVRSAAPRCLPLEGMRAKIDDGAVRELRTAFKIMRNLALSSVGKRSTLSR